MVYIGEYKQMTISVKGLNNAYAAEQWCRKHLGPRFNKWDIVILPIDPNMGLDDFLYEFSFASDVDITWFVLVYSNAS